MDKEPTFHTSGFRAGDVPSVMTAGKEAFRQQLSDLDLVVSRKTEPNFEDKWSNSQLYTVVTSTKICLSVVEEIEAL